MALSPKERSDIASARKRQVQDMVDASSQALDDEIRYCTKCGWKARKSQILAAGIKACPNCGNTQCVAQCMDFGLSPAEVRRLQKQGGSNAGH